MHPDRELIAADIEHYLQAHQNKELLRFVVVGSVDDGKSTLIGRLLHDSHGIYEDQLEGVRRASSQQDLEIDFSLFTDGLKAEREQGITIDVAYRYFCTGRRKFIIADTPGHVQYTRNMATGASTANVAVILLDARLGVLQQSRRHAYLASLLGIPHLLVAVNKMDLVGYSRETFERIRDEFSAFARRIDTDRGGFRDLTFIPISARAGDNVVHRSDHLGWYEGGTVLDYLENVPVADDRNLSAFRFPVQYVLRPNLDYRGFSGQIVSGIVHPGDPIMVLPSRKTSRVASIDTFDGPLDEAFAPMSVTLRLTDEVDVSRGDMLVRPRSLPTVGTHFDAMVVWMSERRLDVRKTYLLEHTTQRVRAEVSAVRWQMDLESLERTPADGLGLNDIGRVRVRCHQPLFYDPYVENRATGSFILIDSLTNDTVAAGMIARPKDAETARYSEVPEAPRTGTWVSPDERAERLRQRAVVVWLNGSGLPACRETAFCLERLLFDAGAVATVIETDGPATLEAAEAAGRAAAVAVAVHCQQAGLLVLCVGSGASGGVRQRIRQAVGDANFFEALLDAAPGTTEASEAAPPLLLESPPGRFDPEPVARRLLSHLEEAGVLLGS